jgi:hypothetical protein
MLTIRAMSDGKGYSSRHLEHGDYYAEGERVLGHWQGRRAELLGLAGEVKPEDFEFLRQGLDPRTGEFLRQRRSADRTMTDGTIKSHGRNLYDFTISAPKSVSVMATLGGDKRLVTAHEKAIAEALKEIESHAEARVRLLLPSCSGLEVPLISIFTCIALFWTVFTMWMRCSKFDFRGCRHRQILK